MYLEPFRKWPRFIFKESRDYRIRPTTKFNPLRSLRCRSSTQEGGTKRHLACSRLRGEDRVPFDELRAGSHKALPCQRQAGRLFCAPPRATPTTLWLAVKTQQVKTLDHVVGNKPLTFIEFKGTFSERDSNLKRCFSR